MFGLQTIVGFPVHPLGFDSVTIEDAWLPLQLFPDSVGATHSRISELDDEISVIEINEPAAVRLQQLRGVGPMIATALVVALGDAHQFANGRQFAASLGLTPRQHSSGGKGRLLGISKRGDAYLRTLLVHGARAIEVDLSLVTQLVEHGPDVAQLVIHRLG